MSNIKKSKDLFTTGEAAAELGVSQTCIASWADRGEMLVTFTPAGWRLIERREIERMRKKMLARIDQKHLKIVNTMTTRKKGKK